MCIYICIMYPCMPCVLTWARPGPGPEPAGCPLTHPSPSPDPGLEPGPMQGYICIYIYSDCIVMHIRTLRMDRWIHVYIHTSPSTTSPFPRSSPWDGQGEPLSEHKWHSHGPQGCTNLQHRTTGQRQSAAAWAWNPEFQAFATNIADKLIVLRGVYICTHVLYVLCIQAPCMP